MLSSTLYSKFPAINYGGEVVTNITARLKFDVLVEDKMAVFYQYTITEGQRADEIASSYYGDPSYTWLIYLANNMFDPTNDWPFTVEQFDQMLVTKYGSVAAANRKILFYRVEWASDESMITSSMYHALPPSNKKYWTPVFGAQRQLMYYERAQHDWVIDTNKVLRLAVAGSLPAPGDYITQSTAGSRSASGEVEYVEGNYVFIKHIVGEFVGNNKTLYVDDFSIGTCTDVLTISNAFATPSSPGDVPPMWTTEENYWVPVTAYEYETELNEAKKTIRLIDPAYVDVIERDIRTIFAE